MTNKQNKESGRKWDGRSRVSNDVYRKRYDEIFRKKPTERNPDPDFDEGRIDIIGQNDCMHYGWHKHDGSLECPVDKEAMVEVETWTPNKIIQKAYQLHWKSVKFYRVIDNV